MSDAISSAGTTQSQLLAATPVRRTTVSSEQAEQVKDTASSGESAKDATTAALTSENQDGQSQTDRALDVYM